MRNVDGSDGGVTPVEDGTDLVTPVDDPFKSRPLTSCSSTHEISSHESRGGKKPTSASEVISHREETSPEVPDRRRTRTRFLTHTESHTHSRERERTHRSKS